MVRSKRLYSFPTRRSSDLQHRRTGVELPSKQTYQYRTSGDHCCRWCTYYRRILGICSRHQKRSEEHTSELQSRGHLVCRLLLEKKKERCISTTSLDTENMN